MSDSMPRHKAQAKDPHGLAPREALFVLKLLELGNQTEAYLAAGYKCKRNTAKVNAARLLTKANVGAALELGRKQTLEKAGIDAAEAFRRLAAIAAFDIGDLIDEAGKVLPLKQLPADVRRSIKRVDLEGNVYMHDVMRALELIAEAGGLIKRKVDMTITFDHYGHLAEVAKRVHGERK